MRKILAIVFFIIQLGYSTDPQVHEQQQNQKVAPQATSSIQKNQFLQISNTQDELWAEEGVLEPEYQVYSQAFAGVKLYGYSVQGNKGGRTLIGGYDTLGANAAIKFTEDLPQHTKLRLSTRLLKIDDWDGSTMMIIIDGQFVWQQQWKPNTGDQYLCGKATSKDNDIPVVLEIKHTAQTATIIFASNIQKDPSIASWGIREYQVEVL